MLIAANSFRQLNFGALMSLYAEENQGNGQLWYPDLSSREQILQAEQSFYDYLREEFFVSADARYWIWEENGTYVSALRQHAYRDGLLLEALITATEWRRKGYASTLVQEMLAHNPKRKIYAHIDKKNRASLALHEKCGFRLISDSAVYLDGSVTNRSFTYLYHAYTG